MPTRNGASKAPDHHEERRREAQATLDQARHQAGGALSGREVRKRWGLDKLEHPDDPPLDWRLTPRNVILQVLAVLLFLGVVGFFVVLITDSLGMLFG